MKVDVTDMYGIVLKEVYVPLTLITNDDEEIVICMRDSGFEFNYQGELYSAQKGEVKRMK